MLVRDQNIGKFGVVSLAGTASETPDPDVPFDAAVPFPDPGAGIPVDQRITAVWADGILSAQT